jgi:hypothetical protein
VFTFRLDSTWHVPCLQVVLISIDETYPKSGSPSQYKRRDSRSGQLTGRYQLTGRQLPKHSAHSLPHSLALLGHSSPARSVAVLKLASFLLAGHRTYSTACISYCIHRHQPQHPMVHSLSMRDRAQCWSLGCGNCYGILAELISQAERCGSTGGQSGPYANAINIRWKEPLLCTSA